MLVVPQGRPARSTHLGWISIELQESRPRWGLGIASANPPMLDMIWESSSPCSDLVRMCERESFAFSKPLVVSEKKIDGLPLSDIYDSVHGFSVACMGGPGLASVGDIQETGKRDRGWQAKVNPFTSSSTAKPSTAKGPPRTPSAHEDALARRVYVFPSIPLLSSLRRPCRL